MLRSKAIQFLNTSRVTKLIEREEINKANAVDIIAAGNLLNGIIKESERLLSDNIPSLNVFSEIINTHVETAGKILNPPAQPEKKIVPVKPAQVETKPQIKVPLKEESSASTPLKLLSEDDSIIQLRRTLNSFFEITRDDETKERIPESLFVFGIARQIQWSNLTLPAAEDNITNIEPPNEIIQKLIKEWFDENKIDLLIPRVELEFIKDNSEFRYWFDAQRYLVKSLEKKGSNFAAAVEDIKFHLARLVKKLPLLEKLKFRGGELPFAGNETIKWINDEVKTAAVENKAGDSGSAILTPIMDKTYDHISKEYAQVISDLPEKFEENFNKMQEGINAELLPKGKVLRRLNLANYCFAAKHYSLAKINLSELKKIIDEYNLAEWEPALCTAIWQSLYLTNIKLAGDTEKEELKINIEKEHDEMFSNIAKYDGVLAIKLINN